MSDLDEAKRLLEKIADANKTELGNTDELWCKTRHKDSLVTGSARSQTVQSSNPRAALIAQESAISRGRELLGRFAGSLLIPMRVVVVKT